MKHPAYHLRTNKAVDRFMLVEAMRCIGGPNELSNYTYYGFGGPYLEEFRLLYEYFPEIKMVSIEGNEETYERQKFHLPCRKIKLLLNDFKSFLAQYSSEDKKSVFWLDNTGLTYGNFGEFMDLIGKVADDSLVKITLRAESGDYLDLTKASVEKTKEEKFREEFSSLLPHPNVNIPKKSEDFAFLLQDMLKIATQRALPSETERVFQPISSFFYADSCGIFTLTGLVCLKSEQKRVRKLFDKFHFANLEWGKPTLIDLPFLSTKERLRLQKYLPRHKNAGEKLYKVLGYCIDHDIKRTKEKMAQYSNFYRYYPQFVRAIP